MELADHTAIGKVTEIKTMQCLAALKRSVFRPNRPEPAMRIIARMLRKRGFLAADDEVVIFSTGSGLMHTDLVPLDGLPVLDPADPEALSRLAW